MKAYLVLDLSVNDFAGFRKYIAEIPAFIAKHSGRYIVQGVQPTTIEGDWKPERMVIIEFPERAKAEAFLGDPEIQDLFKVRHDTTTSKLVLADGCIVTACLPPAIAFSSEVDTGSREENASKQESRASVLIQSEPIML